MKKVLSYCLLFLFLCGFCGLYYSYRLAVYLNYRHNQLMLSSPSQDDKLVLLSIPLQKASLIHWLNKNKEFEYNSRFYDVKSITTASGMMKISCYHDKNEKRLKEEFARHRSRPENSNRFLLKIFTENFLGSAIPFSLHVQYKPVVYVTYSHRLVSNVSDIHSPPPKSPDLFL